jgi:DNA repair exonuclease SbcCD ATPase subunit
MTKPLTPAALWAGAHDTYQPFASAAGSLAYMLDELGNEPEKLMSKLHKLEDTLKAAKEANANVSSVSVHAMEPVLDEVDSLLDPVVDDLERILSELATITDRIESAKDAVTELKDWQESQRRRIEDAISDAEADAQEALEAAA